MNRVGRVFIYSSCLPAWDILLGISSHGVKVDGKDGNQDVVASGAWLAEEEAEEDAGENNDCCNW